MSRADMAMMAAIIFVQLVIGFLVTLYGGSIAVQAMLGIPCIFAAGLEVGLLIVASGRKA